MPDERILIAEDEADVLDMCIRALSREGYQVWGAHNGLEAIDMVKTQPFDLLLTDIKMPGLSGLQAFREIKEYNPDIVGVAITGYGSVDMAIEALKLGMGDFLLKPFSLDDLRTAVSKALERMRLARENTRLKALIPLFQLSQTFMTVTDLDVLLQQVVRLAVQETQADLGVLMLKDEASGELEICAATTKNGPEQSITAFAISPDIVRETIEGGHTVTWVESTSNTPFFVPCGPGVDTEVAAAVAQPIIVQGEKIGVLGLAKRRKGASFAGGDAELLSVLASQAGIAIQNARLFTRLRNAYDKLAALDHLKSEFISIVAHELRTPLAEISTYLALSEQETGRQHPYLQKIARSAERLAAMLKDVTDLRFLEAGQVELRRSNVSLPQMIAEIVDKLSPLATRKKQTITTHIQEGLQIICIDAPKVKAVLENLIHNAITFSPRRGKIDIDAAATGSTLRIAVRDTGIGIPPEEWEWIFQPFYQVQDSLRREHGGFGIGLALSKHLVELHGGRIWVQSKVGEGSTFYVTLPDCVR